jgi:hypothetical protein
MLQTDKPIPGGAVWGLVCDMEDDIREALAWAWLVQALDDSDENDAYCRAAGLLLSATRNTSESYNRLFELAKQLKNEVPS